MKQTNAADPSPDPSDDPSTDPAATRRYLLGAATPAERERIELRLLTDRAYFEEISACEDELLDDYLRGRLSAAERENFESVFLAAPARQQKLKFAHALRRRLERDTPAPAQTTSPTPAHTVSPAPSHTASPARAPRPSRAGFFGRLSPPARLGFASVVLLAAAASVLLAIRAARETTTAPGALADSNVTAGDSRPHASPAATAVTGNRTHPRALVVSLTPGLTRADGKTQHVEIPAGYNLVRFNLLFTPAGHAAYNVSVQPVDGGPETRLANLPADTSGAPAVVFDLQTATLAPGDYRVRLSGLRAGGEAEPLPSYFFRVPKP